MLRQVVQPALPVTVDRARKACRIDDTSEDDLIELYIRSALATAELRCNIAFQPQTLEWTIDGFPSGRLRLPIGPVTSITSITYRDANGTDQTVAGALDADDWISGTWPTGSAVRIQYEAGRGTPEDVQLAILLMVGLYFDNRAEASDAAMNPIPFGAEMILRQHHRMFPEYGDCDG